MKPLIRVLTLASLLASGFVHATQQGKTVDGSPYLTGGVSEEERDALQAQRDHFSLWIVTAQRQTGAYLSAVHLTITDARQKVAFDAQLDGPWLLIDLPPGTYRVNALFEAQSQQRDTTLQAKDHREAIFYFGGGGVPAVSP